MKVIKPVAVPSVSSTFSRASTATWFDFSKSLITAAIDGIRGSWNPETSVYEGVTVEPSRTNRIFPSNMPIGSLSVGSLMVNQPYVLSFYGTGTVTMTGGSGGSLSGTASYPGQRVVLPIVPTSPTITFAFSGSPRLVQFEEGAIATSYIPTLASAASRAAEVISVGQYYSDFTDSTPEYNAVTVYSAGAVIQYLGRKYSGVADANTGNTPGPKSIHWVDLGATNVWAMHDRISGGQSTGTGYRTFAFRAPSEVNAVALINIECSLVTVVVSDGHGRAHSQSKSGTLTAVAFTGFSPGAYVTVSIYNNGGVAKLGECIAGTLFDVGDTEYPLNIGLIDYSKKETDQDFGTTTFVERQYAERINAVVSVKKENHSAAARTLTSLRATPTAYIFADDTEYGGDVVQYGFIRSMTRSIAYPTFSLIEIELESLV